MKKVMNKGFLPPPPPCKRSIIKGFGALTLAEVLIVIGIIGMVADMTIPTLVQNYQNQFFKVAYKKAYADVNNAYRMMRITDDEFIDIVCQGREGCPGCCFDANFGENFKLLTKQFRAIKTCFDNNASQCWECDNGEAALAWASSPKWLGCCYTSYTFIDSSGRSWHMYSNEEGVFFVDTNGFKKPNKIGKDRWLFPIATQENGLITPRFTTDITAAERLCPSGDCKYKTWLYD